MEYKSLKGMYYADNTHYLEIYNKRFNGESTYKFDFDVKNNPAFVVITQEILNKITSIQESDKELLLLMHTLPPIALDHYTKECLLEEIKLTNEIEGIYSTRKEIQDILNNSPNKNPRLEGLVNKYNLLTHEELPLKKCEDIRKLYDNLVLEEVISADPKNKPDGKIFRSDKVHVQDGTGKIIHTGIIEEENVIKYMDSCLDMLENENCNFFIKVAVFHYMFSYIHPFYDGNGRTNRFISSYLLGTKLQNLVSYRLASTIKESIQTYYKMFKDTNDSKNLGDLTLFVTKFLAFIEDSIIYLNNNLHEKIEQLQFYNDIISTKFDDKKVYAIVFVLIQNALFAREGLMIDDFMAITELGSSKIRSILKFLDEKNLLDKTKDGKKLVYRINLDNLI